jgi:hypothetical protein
VLSDPPRYEPNRYVLTPEPVPAEFSWRFSPKRPWWRLPLPVRDATRRAVPALFGLAVLALAASDLNAAGDSFWRSHQMIAGLVGGAALALVAIFGVDRLLAARAKRRWLSFGLMATQDLNQGPGIEEFLYYAVVAFRERRGLGAEMDEDYLAYLVEALRDPVTWAAEEEEDEDEEPNKPLFAWVVGEEVKLATALVRWAPVLVAEASLTDIADAAADVLATMRSVSNILEFGGPERRRPEVLSAVWVADGESAERLLNGLKAHRYAAIRMEVLVERYEHAARTRRGRG